jgi:hypothetical protein
MKTVPEPELELGLIYFDENSSRTGIGIGSSEKETHLGLSR